MLDKVFTAVKNDVVAFKSTYSGLGLTASVFTFFQGRATFFAIAFTGVGIALAFRGKLTADYVGLVTAIQALIVGHSLKEDYFARRDRHDGDNHDSH